MSFEDMNPVPTGDSDFAHATSVAGRALRLMAQHKVPATPQNFEIWFKFSLGTAPALNKTINILIANKREFDGATNRSLFTSYVGAEADWDAKQGEISGPLEMILSRAQGFLARSIADDASQKGAGLRYLSAEELSMNGRWQVIAGDPSQNLAPSDPFMVESVAPRSGDGIVLIQHHAVELFSAPRSQQERSLGNALFRERDGGEVAFTVRCQEFVRQQTVTKRRGVIVPFGEDQ